jgi:hypothetical protein
LGRDWLQLLCCAQDVMKAAPERYKVRVESEARASGPEYARARGERWPAHPPGRLLARIIHIFEDNKSLLCYKHVD